MSLAQRTLRPSRLAVQQSKRSLAAPPPSSPANFATGPPKVTPAGVVQQRVVPTTAGSGAQAIPSVPVTPPPSAGLPPPKQGGGGFRRFVVYTTLLTAGFYSAGTYASLQSPAVEELFAAYVPGGERLIDWAEDKGLDKVGAGEVAGAASALYKKVTSTASTAASSTTGATPPAASDRPAAPGAPFTPVPVKSADALAAAQAKAKAAQASAAAAVKDAESKLGRVASQGESKVSAFAHAAETKAGELAHQAGDALDAAGKQAGAALHAVEDKTVDLKNAALAGIANAKDALTVDRSTVRQAEDKAAGAVDQAKDAAGAVKDKLVAGTRDLASLVAEAEDALKGGFHTAGDKAAAAAAAATKPAVKNAQGLTLWTEPLPIGFEPPPGYYVERKAVAPFAKDEPAHAVGELLPRLAPSLKAADPVISQLAGTFDELTTYLSSVPTATTDAKSLISTAQLDFDAISKRLSTIKAEEEAALAKQLEAKRKEFEGQLREREVLMSNELEKREEGWKEVVEDERRRLVESFRERLQKELEVQQEIVNERLKEEVVTQGIELQRKWIREIKSHVETERGGRLSKLGELEGGLKELEQVTLDNSKVLDENVRIHKLYSALRAVASSLDQPRQPIADKLTALQHILSSSSLSSSSSAALVAVLSTIPASALTEGVESLPDLTYWFTAKVAPRIRSVALVPSDAPSAGVLAHLTSAALSPLLFKKTGPVDGSDINSVLARAEDRLVRRDLDGAAREVNSLEGWAGVLAQDWLKEARKRLEVEQAIDLVSTEAKLASLLVI